VTDKRCGHHEFSCGGICGAELPCGHTCSAVCHDGDCPPCPLVSDVACRCGAETEQLPCSQKGVLQVRCDEGWRLCRACRNVWAAQSHHAPQLLGTCSVAHQQLLLCT